MPTSAIPRPVRAAAALFGLLALLAMGTPAFAKEGAMARLDTVVHRDAEPGSTITIGWSVYQLSNDKQLPIHGSPIYVTLRGPSGTTTEAEGRESPSGSGHYLASIVVPDGGIRDVSVGMHGEACYDGAPCVRADYTFPLTDDTHVVGDPVGFAAPAKPVASAAAKPVASAASTATTPSAAPGTVSNGLVPLVAVGVAFALGGGLTAFVLTRRRQVGIQPTGR